MRHQPLWRVKLGKGQKRVRGAAGQFPDEADKASQRGGTSAARSRQIGTRRINHRCKRDAQRSMEFDRCTPHEPGRCRTPDPRHVNAHASPATAGVEGFNLVQRGIFQCVEVDQRIPGLGVQNQQLSAAQLFQRARCLLVQDEKALQRRFDVAGFRLDRAVDGANHRKADLRSHSCLVGRPDRWCQQIQLVGRGCVQGFCSAHESQEVRT